MQKKLLYFATHAEAASTLSRWHAKPTAGWGKCYVMDHGIIVVGGMGMFVSMHIVSEHLKQVDELWNLGVAGCLNTQYQFGDCLPIATVQPARFYPVDLEERSCKIHKDLHPTLTLQNTGARLISADYPIHQTILRDQLAQEADLVDMEGYGLAYLAQRAGKRCVIWKVVSDFASEGGPKLIQQRLKQASEILADIPITS